MPTIVERLAAGTAFVDASWMRATRVSGADARSWLDDLVSADLSELQIGRARPSLLLAPTGGVRAAFTVVPEGDALLLLQDPAQARPVAELLAMYVLSSDVTLADRTGELAIFAFPGLPRPPEVTGARPSAPSALGAGSDLIAPAPERDRIAAELAERFASATEDDAEAWRVAAGIPRVGVDTAEGDLPQEAALDGSVAFDKGCFVGQEAVAKTRNLGHPRRVLLRFTADGPVAAGEAVRADDGDVGAVTSAVRLADRTHGLMRIRWTDRERPLRTEAGVALEPAG
jgi:folate-binding protein YgfZ